MSAELFVPVDGKGLDWPRKVANAVNSLLRRSKDSEARIATLETLVADLAARVTDLETP